MARRKTKKGGTVPETAPVPPSGGWAFVRMVNPHDLSKYYNVASATWVERHDATTWRVADWEPRFNAYLPIGWKHMSQLQLVADSEGRYWEFFGEIIELDPERMLTRNG